MNIEPEQLQKAVGEGLRKVRLARDLTRAQAAELVGIDENVYERLEHGQVMPTAYTLMRAAASLQLSADELLGLPTRRGSSRGGSLEVDPQDKWAQVSALLVTWSAEELRKLLQVLRVLQTPE